MNPQELIADVLEQIRGMWRYRWWAVGTAWLVWALGSLYVFSMPDIYRASAQVFVDTNSLLGPLMQGLTAQQDPLDEVQLVSKAVLTRPNLEAVAHETDLTLRTETPQEFEALITGLQQRVRVTGGRDNIFTIEYEDPSREKSVEVVAAVVDSFMENAIGNEGNDAELTGRALAGEISAHEERLLEAEARLAEFKKANIGYMPGESGDYYERLQSAIAAVGSVEARIRLLNQRRGELQRQIEGEEPVFGIVSSSLDQAGGCSQSDQISALEAELSTLRVNYTDKHPRIVALQEEVVAIRESCAAERQASGFSSASSDPLDINPVYQNLRIQLSDAEVELAELRAQLGGHQQTVASLRRDVDKIGEVETELKQLNRDYDVVQTRHQELLRRWEDLQAKNRLDPVTEAVQFRRIEPPFALAAPVDPNRPLLLTAVLVFALGAGGAVAFGLNQVHPAFFTRRSLRRAVELPVLGSVSLLSTPALVAKRRAATMGWAGACAALLGATVIAIALGQVSA